MDMRIAAALMLSVSIANACAQLNWTAPVAINSNASTDTAHDTTPRLARGLDGGLALAWVTQSRSGTTTITEARHSDILVSYSSDSGQTWSVGERVSDPEFYNGEVDIAAGEAGNFHLVWNSGDIFSTFRLHTAHTINNQVENTTVTVEPFTENEIGFYSPGILAAGGNEVLIKSSYKVAPDRNNVGGYVWSRSNSALPWSPVSQVDSPPLSFYYRTLPGRLAGDGAANVVAPFVREIEDPVKTAWYYFQVVILTSADSGGTWINRGTVSPLDIPAHFAAVATDKRGMWILLWLENHAPHFIGSVPGENIYIQKSTDNGVTWTAPQGLRVPANTIKTLSVASLATDSSGKWLAVFQGENTGTTGYGTDGEIFYTWSTDDGNTWSPITTIHGTPANDGATDTAPQSAYLGENKWAVIWSRREPGSDADIVMATAPTPVTEIGDWQLYQ